MRDLCGYLYGLSRFIEPKSMIESSVCVIAKQDLAHTQCLCVRVGSCAKATNGNETQRLRRTGRAHGLFIGPILVHRGITMMSENTKPACLKT